MKYALIAEERRLQEERDEPFHRQRGTKDVSHEARVSRPIHSELEFLHDACHHSDRERDEHQLSPEASDPIPNSTAIAAAFAVGQGLHGGDEQRQSDRHRHDNEVVDRRRSELPAGQGVGAHHVTAY